MLKVFQPVTCVFLFVLSHLPRRLMVNSNPASPHVKRHLADWNRRRKISDSAITFYLLKANQF